MCLFCGDVLDGCPNEECGAAPRYDEQGNRRMYYFKWFTEGEIPCHHVLARHKTDCAINQGRHCDCEDDEDE